MLYNEVNQIRRKEFEFCLLKNLNNTLIKKYVVFYDTSLDYLGEPENTFGAWLLTLPLQLVSVNKRIHYGDALEFTNLHYPNEIAILSNGDIYFDNSLSLLAQIDYENSFLSITRDDFIGGVGDGSSDVWVYKSPIKNFSMDVQMGTSFCDQIISYLAVKSGLKVYNPCHSINCYHHHHSEIRNMPGTHLHKPLESSTTDNMLGMNMFDLKHFLENKYGIQLMCKLQNGGGLIPSCRVNNMGKFLD